MFFLFFFPISGRRPEIPVLAGGQGPNTSTDNKRANFKTPPPPPSPETPFWGWGVYKEGGRV